MWIQATNMWIETTTMWILANSGRRIDETQGLSRSQNGDVVHTVPGDFVSKVYENPIRCGSA